MASKDNNIINFNSVKNQYSKEATNEATNELDLEYLKMLSRQPKSPNRNREEHNNHNRRRTVQENHHNKHRPVRRPSHNKKRNYSSSRRRNAKHICNKLIATGMLSAAVLLGGVAGYNMHNANLASTEYSLDNYDKTELFNNTDNLIEQVAENTYFEKNPDIKDSFDGYFLESYNEVSISGGAGDVTLRLNYSKLSHDFSGGVNSKSIEVKLPKDFAKDVYLNYSDLRKSSRVSDERKEKTSYWLKMNKCVTNLKDGLNNYIQNTEDKDYSKAAKDVLENSKINNAPSKEDDYDREF